MSDNEGAVPEAIYHFDDHQSFGGESQTTDGSSLKTIDDRVGSVEPVELGRGLCRVIFSYGRNRPRVEVVCSGQYGKCGRQGHQDAQKDESKRGSCGWYVGVYSRANKLVGGQNGTCMNADSARGLMDARRNANRKVVIGRGIGSKVPDELAGRKAPARNTPESGTGTSWVDPQTGKSLGTTFKAVGEALTSVTDDPVSLKGITDHILQAQKDTSRGEVAFTVGARVGFRQGRRMITGRVIEVYPGETLGEEPFYYVARDDGGEIQIGEKSLYEVTPERETSRVTETPVKEVAQVRGDKEQQLQEELEMLRSQVRKAQAAVPSPTSVTGLSPGPNRKALYAVARGRSEDSVGVYDFKRAAQEIKGVPDAMWKKVNTEEEGWQYIEEEQEKLLREMMGQGNEPSPVHHLDSALGANKETSLQEAVRKIRNMGIEAGTDPDGNEEMVTRKDNLSELGGRVTGPDPSMKTEGKIFGILITDGTRLRHGLVPCPRSMSPASQAQLLGQALDVTMLPMTDYLGGSEGAETNAALTRALASMAGTQTELELGGEPIDHNWKGSGKISLTRVKSLTVLKERISELRSNKRAIEQVLLGRLASVLYHAGYDQTVAEDWAATSTLYRMGCDSQYHYIQLHEHILSRCYDDESECNFENAKLDVDLHIAELSRLRNLWPSRIQMVCAIYAYLRDQSEKSFRSEKLQEKRQTLQLVAMRKQAAKMEEMMKKLATGPKTTSSTNDRNNPSSDRNNDRGMCWHCGQRGLHGNGRRGCLWKDLPSEEAKVKGAEHVAQKTGQGGGK